MTDTQDVPIGWRVFCILLVAAPGTFLILSWLVGETSTTKALLPFTFVAIGLFLLLGKKRRDLALHGIVGSWLTYQTYVLSGVTREPSIGIVWFTAVPVLVALLGKRSHIFLWTPITLACVVFCWYSYAEYPYMAHPLSLPNLIGATVLISAAAYGIVADRDHRESSLESTIEMVRAEAAERRQAEKEATAARNAMSTFLASVSHEVRNPLTSIVLSAEFLALTSDEESEESIRTIRQSADSLMLVVNDILELAKNDAGAIQVQEEPFQLGELLDEVVRSVGPLFQSCKMRLFVGALPWTPANWVGDSQRIHQVIVNLVSNALAYSKGTAVWVVAIRTETGLRIEVGDNGCGISEQDQTRVFQPFERLEQAHSESPRGAGLGLAISRGYVRAMGGELLVQSKLGEGSVFYFDVACKTTSDVTLLSNSSVAVPPGTRLSITDELPEVRQWAIAWLQSWGVLSDPSASSFCVEEQLRDSVVCLPELRSAVSSLFGEFDQPKLDSVRLDQKPSDDGELRGKILLCDDEEKIRNSLGRILSLFGFEILACESGDEFIRLAQTMQPDVALLDVQLIGENGVDLMKRLRQLPGPAARLPVCMLSGSMQHRQASIDAGANEYLLKPPDKDELLDTIGNLLDKASYPRCGVDVAE